jgi:hypothetical protein
MKGRMAAKPSPLRVVVITGALAFVLVITAIWLYHPAVHRKMLTLLVFLAALPLGLALRAVDRLVFGSRRLGGLPEIARTGLVFLAGIALSAAIMAMGYFLAGLANLNEPDQAQEAAKGTAGEAGPMIRPA